MQQNRGTMCKSFHAGKAASSGVLAALLAQGGFDSSSKIIEGRRGFCRIYSDTAAPERLTSGLGAGWEVAGNGHKPYACGGVLHPVIDALVQIHRDAIVDPEAVDPEAVETVELQVHPHVLSITGVVEPATGLQSKFSVYHSAAVALIDGAAGIQQYADQRALDPAVARLRRKVKAVADETLRKDQAFARVTVAGRTLETNIQHASGTIDNPMTDEAIERKFMANAEPAIGTDAARRVRDMVWKLEAVADMRELIAALA